MRNFSRTDAIAQLDLNDASDSDVTLSAERVQPILIQATHASRLAEVAEALLRRRGRLTDDAQTLVEAALAACTQISRSTAEKQQAILANLRSRGICAEGKPDLSNGQTLQRHIFRIRIPTEQLGLTLRSVAEAGYRPAERLGAGAIEVLTRTHSTLSTIRDDEATTRMEIAWHPQPTQQWPAKLLPSIEDLTSIQLGKALWWLYPGVKIARKFSMLLNEDRASVYLGTPRPLLPALFEFARLSVDDVLLDIGCGDGRVIIDAALTFGCRAIGVEFHPLMAAKAREAIARANLRDRVALIEDRAEALCIPEATVAFMFLPRKACAHLIPIVRAKIAPNARIVFHEQAALDFGLTPSKSQLLYSDNGLTVAHLREIESGEMRQD